MTYASLSSFLELYKHFTKERQTGLFEAGTMPGTSYLGHKSLGLKSFGLIFRKNFKPSDHRIKPTPFQLTD